MTKKPTNSPDRLDWRDPADELLQTALLEQGVLIPQTVEEVRLARAALTQIEPPPLPASLADPQWLRHRLAHATVTPRITEQPSLLGETLSLAELIKRLANVGIDRQLLRRLVPASLLARWGEQPNRKTRDQAEAVSAIAGIISHVFGWTVEAILNPASDLELAPTAMASARFKMPANVNSQRVNAYTVYVHLVALLLLEATAHLPRQPVPPNATELRRAIKQAYGAITFENALRYVWSLGIPVLPLSDAGAFHGACWRVEGRNVIALKQTVRSLARWLFDLIHELTHAGKNPEQANLSIIESDISLAARRLSPEEKEANQEAGNVSLDGRAEILTQMCVDAAGGKVEYLKRVVPQIAAKEGVGRDALANYIAYRLAPQGINWWPTANKLQNTEIDPLLIARRLLREHTDFSRLSEFDRNLLEQALRDEIAMEEESHE
jgi:hypothetical protein